MMEHTMFEQLPVLPPDPILGLAAACRADPNPEKVDLTIGIYMDEAGVCPVFKAVQAAQQQLIEEEVTKAYIAPQGDPAFIEGITGLVLGEALKSSLDNRVSAIQAPGGCGALRIAAEVLYASNPDARVWVSNPTWPVHIPLIGSVGLQFETYRYYDAATHGVDFEGMMADLENAEQGDIVLLHGCCHNPSGADLTADQWQAIGDLAVQKGFLPMIDIAYQGMGDGLDQDAAGLRALVERLPEVVIAASCSKNLGLYRERTGAAIFVCDESRAAEATLSQAKVAARKVYSMPPAHGAILAGKVLTDTALRSDWEAELSAMCERIQGLRQTFRDRLQDASGRDFGFIAREKGMFSFLGLSAEQAQKLRADYSIYMLDSSRINVASLNAGNMDKVVAAVVSVL
jgi:aspartate aminotransferase